MRRRIGARRIADDQRMVVRQLERDANIERTGESMIQGRTLVTKRDRLAESAGSNAGVPQRPMKAVRPAVQVIGTIVYRQMKLDAIDRESSDSDPIREPALIGPMNRRSASYSAIVSKPSTTSADSPRRTTRSVRCPRTSARSRDSRDRSRASADRPFSRRRECRTARAAPWTATIQFGGAPGAA